MMISRTTPPHFNSRTSKGKAKPPWMRPTSASRSKPKTPKSAAKAFSGNKGNLAKKPATDPPTVKVRTSDMHRVWTDGSALNNGKPDAVAGLGVFFGPGDSRNVSESLEGEIQTNQRAELTAISRVLEMIPLTRTIITVTDSMYSIKCIVLYPIEWRKNGWRTSRGKGIENLRLITSILDRVEERRTNGAKTYFKWVKGHGNDAGNIAADALAGAAAELAAQAGITAREEQYARDMLLLSTATQDQPSEQPTIIRTI